MELQETNNKVHDSRALKGVADQRITEMTQELENNAGATHWLLHAHALVVPYLDILVFMQWSSRCIIQSLLLKKKKLLG